MTDLVTFTSLAWPVLLSFTLIALQFLVRAKDLHESRLSISVLGLITIETGVAHVIIARVVFALTSLALLAVPAIRDYSGYFPTYYEMNVYFDDPGITDSLSQFSEHELEALRLKPDWEPDKKAYLTNVNRFLNDQLDIPFYFGIDSTDVHSKGSTTFYVSTVKGWQRYLISASKGRLEHTLEIPERGTEHFESEFELLETANNHIEVSLSEIYIFFTKVIKPMYKQLISVSPTKKQYHHKLMAVTKVRLFPVVNVGRTVYLLPVNDGWFVPIGYCIYQPK